MVEHAYAPSKVAAPALWARFTWVRELGLTWADTGGVPDPDEINLLVELANLQNEAQALKARVAQKAAQAGS